MKNKHKLSEFIAACALVGVSIDKRYFPYVVRKSDSTNPMYIDDAYDMKVVAVKVAHAYGMKVGDMDTFPFIAISRTQYRKLVNDIVPEQVHD